ncbi:hypothetical protein [Flavobacterium sp. DSR2-3-3]|uniref:hypothetical protein n=1 Tax=Flavobacterium sp. DSR2-3-3 TaxID=2804632 RepID=UPI003CFB45A7
MNKNSIDFNSEKTFKEDYYITQRSSDTNLILVVFAVLITFSGVFTYVNILERWNSKMTEINTERDKQNEKYKDYEHNLMVLKSELDFQIGLIYSDRGTTLIKDNFNDGLMMCFCSMEKYSTIGINSPFNLKEEALKLLNTELKYLNKLIDDNDIFEINIEYKIYKDRIDRITKVLDYEALNMFNRIISKIRINATEK